MNALRLQAAKRFLSALGASMIVLALATSTVFLVVTVMYRANVNSEMQTFCADPSPNDTVYPCLLHYTVALAVMSMFVAGVVIFVATGDPERL